MPVPVAAVNLPSLMLQHFSGESRRAALGGNGMECCIQQHAPASEGAQHITHDCWLQYCCVLLTLLHLLNLSNQSLTQWLPEASVVLDAPTAVLCRWLMGGCCFKACRWCC